MQTYDNQNACVVDDPDLVRVVRCKDCRYGITIGGKIACTEVRERIHSQDDFCSYGEKSNP